MGILDNLFGTPAPETGRPAPLARNQAQRTNLSAFRKPWHNYWVSDGGTGFYVVGGPKRKAEIFIPALWPTRCVARSIAKYLTRSARIRIDGTIVR